MINVLGIGLDYLMLQNDKVRGDVRERQFEYAQQLNSLTLIVYTPYKLRMSPQQWTDNLWIYPTNSKGKRMFVFDALRIASGLCREKKIDAITTEDPFVTGIVGYILKKRFKIPLNVQVHIDFCDNPHWLGLRRLNILFNRLGKLMIKKADTVRVGTTWEREKFVKALRIEGKRIFCIPVNIHLDNFKNADGSHVRKEYLNGKFDTMVLFTGRLAAQKDIPTLLKSFQIVVKERPQTLLMIVGQGIKEKVLRGVVSQLGIDKHVIFRGSIGHQKIPQYLSACDIYAVSSVFEGTCIAMAEAMAAGKPVVTTRFAGAEDLVSDGSSGFIVEQKDYKAMAEKMLYLINNADQAREMGQKGLFRVGEIFSDDRNIAQMIELWERTAKLKGIEARTRNGTTITQNKR